MGVYLSHQEMKLDISPRSVEAYRRRGEREQLHFHQRCSPDSTICTYGSPVHILHFDRIFHLPFL